MKRSFSPSAQSPFMLVLVLALCLSACDEKEQSTSPPVAGDHIFRGDDPVESLLRVVTDRASQGASAKVTFRVDDGPTVSLDFPLMDGNKTHWQHGIAHAATKGIEDGEGVVVTALGKVIVLRHEGTGWRSGKAILDDAAVLTLLQSHAPDSPPDSLKNRTALVFQVSPQLLMRAIAPVWARAEELGMRIVVMDLEA